MYDPDITNILDKKCTNMCNSLDSTNLRKEIGTPV